MGKVIFDQQGCNIYDQNLWVVVVNNGELYLEAREGVTITADQAVDLATKIINHCYPFTIPKRNKDD